MNFLNVFEERISGLFGDSAQAAAPFSFKKLAKKASSELEKETYVINGVDTAPALFTVLISADDDAAMRPLYASLTQETALFLEAHAQRRGYTFVGAPLVRFMVDPSLKHGKFSVFAENVDARTLDHLRVEEQEVLSGAPAPAPAQGRAAATPRAGASGRPRANALEAGLGPIGSPVADNADAGLDVISPSTVLDVVEDAYISEQPGVPVARPEAPVGSNLALRPEPVAPYADNGVPQAAVPATGGPSFSAAENAPAAGAGAPSRRHAASTPLVNPHADGSYSATPSYAGYDVPGAPAPVAPSVQQPATSVPGPTMAPPTQRRNVPLVNPRAGAAPRATGPSAVLIDRQSGRTYACTSDRCIIGRERTTGGIVLHDPNVSRRHAELSYQGGHWLISDLKSMNGTLVNDVDIERCVLRDGDLITLGLTNLEFREG